jgi:hypothetical protein
LVKLLGILHESIWPRLFRLVSSPPW